MCSLSEWTEDAMDLGVEQFGLGGRTALVTGAGRGVGAGIARVLAAAGATVALLGAAAVVRRARKARRRI